MSLKAIVVKSESFGTLKYLGETQEITRRVRNFNRTNTVTDGHRYKLLDYSGGGKHVIVNVLNRQKLIIPFGSEVKLVNPIITVESVEINGFSRPATVLYADDIAVVK